MLDTIDSRPSFAHSGERTLATLLLVLLATYVLGSLVEGAIPTVHTVGVVAVHLAVVVGVLFPLAVIGRTAFDRCRADDADSRVLETGTATLTLIALGVGIWQEGAPFADVLLAAAVGGTLLLAGLVIR